MNSGKFAPLSDAKYVRLTTFRRDGTSVATPVHFVVDEGVGYFRTWDVAGKAKRLRNNPSVEVVKSTARGKPRGISIEAQAMLLKDGASERAAQLIEQKHPFLHGRLIPWLHRRKGWVTQQYRLE
jgi:hypothetical protein